MLDKILAREVVAPILIISISVILYGIFKRITKKIVETKMRFGDAKKTKTILILCNNIIKYLILLIDVLMILEVFHIDTKTIIASLGVVGVVIGLALQDTLKDFLAGMFILFENQYKLGDYITIGTFMGEVISLGMKTTKIRSYTGEVKMISNRFITEVTNHSVKDSLAIVDVPIAYEADTEAAERIMKKACTSLSKEIPDLTGKVEVLGVEKLDESGVVFRIVAPCKAMTQYGVQRIIRKKIKLVLEFNQINIPYPQVVVHNG